MKWGSMAKLLGHICHVVWLMATEDHIVNAVMAQLCVISLDFYGFISEYD